MGRWRITIDGVGCHHNSNPAIDADIAARALVDQLMSQGHAIEAARFEALGANLPVFGEGGVVIRTSYVPDAVDQHSSINIDFLQMQKEHRAAPPPATWGPQDGDPEPPL